MRKLKNKLFYRLYNLLVWLFGMRSEFVDAMTRAQREITFLRTDKAKLEAQVSKHDRGTALDVRSQLSAIDLDSLGEIIWITVADERMLRQAVFTQIRDYYASHGKGQSIILLTGPNVTLKTLTEEDLLNARLRRMTRKERAAAGVSLPSDEL